MVLALRTINYCVQLHSSSSHLSTPRYQAGQSHPFSVPISTWLSVLQFLNGIALNKEIESECSHSHTPSNATSTNHMCKAHYHVNQGMFSLLRQRIHIFYACVVLCPSHDALDGTQQPLEAILSQCGDLDFRFAYHTCSSRSVV
jgi:hypothetical protein